jgi:lysophospholipase L1-like esterase
MIKQIILCVGISIASILVSLLIIEIIFRTLNITPPLFQVSTNIVKLSENPILGYELNPKNSEFNNIGLRSPIIQLEKKTNTNRLLMLGDSVAYGCCNIPLSETMSLKLVNLLNGNSPQKSHFEIINAGVLGYNTIQEAELFRVKLQKFKPDIIFWEVTIANDYLPKTFEYDLLLLHQKEAKLRLATNNFYEFASKANHVLYTLYSYRYLLYILSSIQSQSLNTRDYQTLLSTIDKSNNYWNIISRLVDKKDSENPWSKSTIIPDGFKLLKKALNYNARIVVVIFPDLHQNLNNYSQMIMNHHSDVVKWAKTNNFEYVDLLPCYQESLKINPNINLILDGVHPNANGHEVAAKCIYDFLNHK